jgi:hypothetical protein
MMRRIDHPPRCRQGRNDFCEGAASRMTPGGFTPRSATRIIRDDTRGTPSAFRPWTKCRPNQGRCANEENARVFHQGPDTAVVHREAGYIHAALFLSGASRDTPSLPRRRGPYIILCSKSSHTTALDRSNGISRKLASSRFSTINGETFATSSGSNYCPIVTLNQRAVGNHQATR